MYRFPNPQHYANHLARKGRAAYAQPGSGRGRSQSRNRAAYAQPGSGRGRSQSKGRAAYAQPGPQRPHRAQRRNGRGLGGELDQLVHTDDGQTQLWVKKMNGVRYAVPVDHTRGPPSQDGKVFNGPVVRGGNTIWMVKGNRLYPAETHEEQTQAFDYARKLTTGKRAGPPKKKRQAPAARSRIAQSPYTGVYEAISSSLSSLKQLSRDQTATTFADLDAEPVRLGEMLREAGNLAKDLMSSSGFFEGRREKYAPGVALQYLYHERDLSQVRGRKDGEPPKFLVEFDEVVKGTSKAMPSEKYSAVFKFLSSLRASIVKAVNSQANHVREAKRQREVAEGMLRAVPVEADSGDLRAVEDAIADEIFKKDEAGIQALHMTVTLNRVIPYHMALRAAKDIGEDTFNYIEFLRYIFTRHPALQKFVMAREKTFKEAVKKARKTLKRRKADAIKQAARAGAPTEAPVNPKSGGAIASGLGLVSMRYS